eukprot:973417-Rhodomonas_salina.1
MNTLKAPTRFPWKSDLELTQKCREYECSERKREGEVTVAWRKGKKCDYNHLVLERQPLLGCRSDVGQHQ